MINMVIAWVARWGRAVRLPRSGRAVMAVPVGASASFADRFGLPIWLTLAVTGVACVITAEAIRRYRTATPRPVLDAVVERDITASLTDDNLRWALTTWSKRYL